jgi:ATP/maltotriose-dependent transcriptional regulator MalT
MNAKGFAQWEKLEEEFLNSDLAETEFCQSRSLSLKWFRKQRRKAENCKWRIESKEPDTAKNLFVELVTESEPATEQLEKSAVTSLKVRFPEVDFKLNKISFPTAKSSIITTKKPV